MNRREEHLEKVERVRHWLRAHDYQAALFTTQGSFSWITAGGEAHVSLGDEVAVAFVLVALDRVFLLTNAIESQRMVEEELSGLQMAVEVWPWDSATGFQATLSQVCNPSMTASDRPGLGELIFDTSLREIRYALLPPEIERYRLLGRDAALVVEQTCQRIAPGVSELEVAAEVAKSCCERAILPLVNLVAADDRIKRYRHPIPTAKRIAQTAMLVLTGRRQGLHISLTRLVVFGNLDAETQLRHEAVARVDAAYILGSRPGRRLSEVLEDGLRQYAVEGFPEEWALHHQGGLTGYAGRELFATRQATHELQERQALAWNPSITGTKSEDTIIVGEGGPEILSETQDWPAVEVEFEGQRILRPAILVR